MHTLLKILLLLLLASLGQQALGSEIINGEKVKEGSRLYMASVQNGMGHLCGGFLISEDYVVTAAHCDDLNPTTVVLGTHNLKEIDCKMRYGIEKKCKHPDYLHVGCGNDIMLLKLSKEARNGKDKPIKPLDLPRPGINNKAKKMCSVAGWGKTKTNGNSVDELREAKVPIVDLKKCEEIWGGKLPNNVICAGGYGSQRGFCQGDSGGPLVCAGNVAVGVVSFNNGSYCDYPDVPNVYTDLQKFVPWITNILRKNKC
ncbi:duodenase-1-like [Salarias fasciatus]|uniref:trypsin n=1 Tax=Salarias fasciatus TaxID=181472 RepID=A0A672FY70_SALFA|nr:duodenase-1-like [Salarias fasciatus]